MKKLSSILIVIVLITCPFWVNLLQDSQGTDDKALDLVGAIKPGYEPWIANQGLHLTETTEPLMFSVQIALGVLLFAAFAYYLKKDTRIKNSTE